MRLRPWTFALVAAALLVLGLGRVAPAAARDVPQPTHAIDANVNDPAIESTRGQNFVWLGPASHRVGRLLLFMPSGGATNLPQDWRGEGSVAPGPRLNLVGPPHQKEGPAPAPPPPGRG